MLIVKATNGVISPVAVSTLTQTVYATHKRLCTNNYVVIMHDMHV